MGAPIRTIFKTEKQKLLEKLSHYGITEIPYLLTESGHEKVRGYSGILSGEEIKELNMEVGVELVGFYLFHNYPDSIRLSFDAVQAFKNQLTKNILELNDKQAEEFLKGRDVVLSKEENEKLQQKGETCEFKIIKNKSDFLGTGKLTKEGRIVNYMPKERRLR